MMSAGLAVIMASAGGAQAYSAGISIVRVGSATSHDLALSVTRGLPIQSVVPAGGGGTLGPGRMPLPDTLHLSLRLGTSTADRLIYSFNRKPDGRANGEAGFATRQTGDSTTYAFRMQFEGLIAQLSLPALDGASKTACAIDAGILPGSISAVLNAAKKVRVQPAPAATCLLSDFEVTIDRMGKLRVVSVDTIILRRVGAG
jgi:hypothetical protein